MPRSLAGRDWRYLATTTTAIKLTSLLSAEVLREISKRPGGLDLSALSELTVDVDALDGSSQRRRTTSLNVADARR